MSASGIQRLLHEISLELSTLPSSEALCHRAVQWGLENLGFDRLSLWFIDPNDPKWSTGTWGTDEEGALRDERAARNLRDPIIAPPEFYEGKIPVLHFHDQPCFDEHRHRVGVADKALAPLWDGKVMVGELAVDNFLTHRPIQVAELDALVLFARIVAHLHSLMKTREALATMSEERMTLLRELKHRTRNNLSVITNLVSLEAMRAQLPETKAKLEGLRDRVDAMGSLYALLDHETHGAPVPLQDYLATVATRLTHAHGADTRGIRLVLDLDPVSLDDQRAASVGIALNELLTDTLKYAFPAGNGGTITVSLTRANERAELVVRDTGRGLPAGFALADSKGLGLGLVDAIARQLLGTFTFESDRGAVFRINFPIDS